MSVHHPVNTKHLYNMSTMLDQSRSRWADVIHMLYKCFVFAGYALPPPPPPRQLHTTATFVDPL